jgi:dihydroorotase
VSNILIKNATIVNEGSSFIGGLLVKGEIIDMIGQIPEEKVPSDAEIIDASGLLLIPGVIDDQVHFREPGLTHKGDIYTESRAAAAGGTTSFMDMPNTIPQTVSNSLLREKLETAAGNSFVNYSF